MPIAEREYELDPTLQMMRMYDKLNPELEGFEDVDRRGARLCGRAYWAFDEKVGTDSVLALADLEDTSFD